MSNNFAIFCFLLVWDFYLPPFEKGGLGGIFTRLHEHLDL
ncbi:hypothetical protein HAPS_2133 [Glaesserella parasuis SH0165]|uniref:Uncharacterized protein n=1 Tax=Glaesserella parasuis serovar 5 (strain SH0165) TaxID=557723 RepID=B8F8C6_GLAP5|nr:hypothetical protein HAPS_2133 [Glaesserella parasuis SH0165]